MSRDVRLYLDDIIEHAERVRTFTAGMDEAAFVADVKTLQAVVYSLLAIGEAVKHLPAETRSLAPEIAWDRAAAMRNRLAHGYHSVDAGTVWDVVVRRLPGSCAMESRASSTLCPTQTTRYPASLQKQPETPMPETRKKLIEVALPLDAINAASARERSIRPTATPARCTSGGRGGRWRRRGR